MLGPMKRARVNARREQAFTLVELLIAVAVVAVLLTLAAPSFRDFILMQRLKSVHAQLVTDLQYARSEAVSSGAVVNVRVMQSSAGSVSCYILFHDYPWDYATNGASKAPSACDCKKPAGSRCPTSDQRELRTVQIPPTDRVRFITPTTRQEVAFDPKTGGMVLSKNEAGMGTGTTFQVYARIDTARVLSTVVGLSGRPSTCRPPGSTLPVPEC